MPIQRSKIAIGALVPIKSNSFLLLGHSEAIVGWQVDEKSLFVEVPSVPTFSARVAMTMVIAARALAAWSGGASLGFTGSLG